MKGGGRLVGSTAARGQAWRKAMQEARRRGDKTLAEIGREYGVTKQAIHYHIHKVDA